MRRYFFTTEDGEVIRDFEGEVLLDETAAKCEAIKMMGSILRDQPNEFLDGGRWRMIVSEKARGDLFTIETMMKIGSEISDWGNPDARTRPNPR